MDFGGKSGKVRGIGVRTGVLADRARDSLNRIMMHVICLIYIGDLTQIRTIWPCNGTVHSVSDSSNRPDSRVVAKTAFWLVRDRPCVPVIKGLLRFQNSRILLFLVAKNWDFGGILEQKSENLYENEQKW